MHGPDLHRDHHKNLALNHLITLALLVPYPQKVQQTLQSANSSGDALGPLTVVQIVYLQSYDKMGRANVTCSGGVESD